jgi:hypothetical protein
MVDYKNGRIYKFVSKECGTVRYVGSTTQALSKRFATHRCESQTKPTPFHKWVIDNGGWDCMDMVLIENCPCDNKEELHRRERYWIEEFKPNLNKQIPTRTIKEWYDENRDKLRMKQCEYRAEYRAKNRDKRNEYRRQYRINNRDEINEKQRKYYVENRDKVKEYRAKNRDKRNEYSRQYGKEYRKNNRDEINEYQRQYRARKNAESIIE